MSYYPPPQHKRAPKTSDISKEYPEYCNRDRHTQGSPSKHYYRPGTQPHTNQAKNYIHRSDLLHSNMQFITKNQKNLATKTTKLSKMTILRNCKMECPNRISLRQYLSSYIHCTAAPEVITVHYCGAPGKQSSQAMHDLHEETGIGHIVCRTTDSAPRRHELNSVGRERRLVIHRSHHLRRRSIQASHKLCHHLHISHY